jgi:hypothetical protein
LLIFGIVYFYPQKYYKTYSGVAYRLGDNAYAEKVQIIFDGSYYKCFFKKGVYKGDISVGEKKLSNAEIKYYAPYKAMLTYYDDKIGEYIDYGIIITDNIKKHFCIGVYEPESKKKGSKIWSSKNGLVISAPATDINDADELSSELIKKIEN